MARSHHLGPLPHRSGSSHFVVSPLCTVDETITKKGYIPVSGLFFSTLTLTQARCMSPRVSTFIRRRRNSFSVPIECPVLTPRELSVHVSHTLVFSFKVVVPSSFSFVLPPVSIWTSPGVDRPHHFDCFCFEDLHLLSRNRVTPRRSVLFLGREFHRC